MVRRLVEHEQIGLEHQQFGQMRAHDPSARHLLRRAVEIRITEGQALENPFRLRLELVAIERGELILGVTVFLRSRRPGGLVLFHEPENFLHLRGDGHGDFQHRFLAHGFRLLGQEAGDGVFIAHDFPFVGFLDSQDQTEEGGFARSVRADEGHPFAPVEGVGNPLEQGSARIALGQIS